ncbi:TPA: DUF2544 domain-containing protein [Escherichia coli]|nr:DUF2544 domain-containing protein [Escherichia coli]EHD2967656.1 DUF2544 domain-containing protein [Escherichia coli]EKJ3308319.1 DUF2544 domain-containing protein [Escherichia coli]EKM4466113.1 DUF2544 domain-containing protein [Escherichia coli]NJB24001.1 DUF2544 domain-containing protein [Escherichia coli]
MKMIKRISLLAVLFVYGFIPSLQAKDYNGIMIYDANYHPVGYTDHIINIDFSTVGFGTHGVCTMPEHSGQYFTCTWTPDIQNPVKITLKDWGNANSSHCPGLPDDWDCQYAKIDVQIPDQDFCPWTVKVFMKSTNIRAPESYIGPSDMFSACSVNVAPYDVSWNPDFVSHEITLNLRSTGSTITKMLQTYLMKDNKLCDSSKMDERGAYCRYVSSYTRMTPAGCGDSRVRATAVEKGIDDTALHDVTININTSQATPINTTCEFLYVIEPQ